VPTTLLGAVLADRPTGMNTRELAKEIERRRLYLSGQGEPTD
jgi:hypothetical protein